MLKKFLVKQGKNMYLASAKPPQDSGTEHVLALHLPLDVFWKLEDMMLETQFLLSSGAIGASVLDSYKDIFRVSAPYAVHERDRAWLYEQKKISDNF